MADELNLDWNDLKLVLAIAEAGTLSGATKLLKTSQPTISRRLAELEKTLALQVFDRSLEGYQLTPAGHRIHACALQMEFEARKIERDIASDTGSQGNIIITATENITNHFVIPQLARFKNAFPGVTFEIVISYDAVNVARRVADIAIRLGNLHDEGLEHRHLGQVHFSLFASEEYLEKNGTPKHLSDLKRHAIIGSSGDISNLMQAKLLQEASEGAPILFATNSLLNQLAAVQAGFGIMALPSYLALGTSGLRQILVDAFNPALDLWILAHKDVAQVERIQALVNFLADGISDRLKDYQ